MQNITTYVSMYFYVMQYLLSKLRRRHTYVLELVHQFYITSRATFIFHRWSIHSSVDPFTLNGRQINLDCIYYAVYRNTQSNYHYKNSVITNIENNVQHQHVHMYITCKWTCVKEKAIAFPIFSFSKEDLNPSHFLNTLCMKRENQHIIRVYGHTCNETEEAQGSLSS